MQNFWPSLLDIKYWPVYFAQTKSTMPVIKALTGPQTIGSETKTEVILENDKLLQKEENMLILDLGGVSSTVCIHFTSLN